MHIFIITLFLISACNHSTPHPVKNNETRNLVLSELHNLGNTCNNSFLVDTIKNKSELCKINETINMSDLCFMFYDINTQLCDVFNYSEFDLENNYKTKIEETQNVELLCDHAKLWNLATIEKNSVFKFLEQVLKNPKHCHKLCEVSDLLSDDSNFFCKYFNWGNELIQPLRHTSQATNPVVSASETIEKSADSGGVALSSSTNANVKEVKNESDVKPLNEDMPIKVVVSPIDQVITPKKSEEKPQTLTQNQIHDHIAQKIETDSNGKITGQSATPVGISSVKKEEKIIPVISDTVANKDNVDKSGQQPQDTKEAVLETPKGKAVIESGISEDDEPENEDYEQVGEEVVVKKNEGLQSDPQMDKEHKSPKFEIESIDENSAQRGNIYASDSFPTDDDHFFPFFLTAIIIVVLLYILYHNKNKFTKLILGLIVEGRQSGRRRNSRGHAYRRLDTLEQAMSTNTAAPPSKIIY